MKYSEVHFKIFKKMGIQITYGKHDFDLKKFLGGRLCGAINAILIERSHVLTPISKNQKLLIDFIILNNAFNRPYKIGGIMKHL